MSFTRSQQRELGLNEFVEKLPKETMEYYKTVVSASLTISSAHHLIKRHSPVHEHVPGLRER